MIGDWVQIGNRAWNVIVTEISEDASILYTENTGRVMEEGAPLTLDPLGTFFSHKVTFSRKRGYDGEYDLLFDYLLQPRHDGIPVKIVHGQTTISYDAYVSSGSRKIKSIDDKKKIVNWDSMQVTFIPIRAQVTPNG